MEALAKADSLSVSDTTRYGTDMRWYEQKTKTHSLSIHDRETMNQTTGTQAVCGALVIDMHTGFGMLGLSWPVWHVVYHGGHQDDPP